MMVRSSFLRSARLFIGRLHVYPPSIRLSVNYTFIGQLYVYPPIIRFSASHMLTVNSSCFYRIHDIDS